MNAPTSWQFEADFMQACNCDFGCPCEFSAPPTLGYCEGMGAYRIKSGRCGDIALDGLGLAFCAHWPKAIHLGGGTGGILIDERADERQRDALVKITRGDFGGLPFEILASTCSRWLPPQFAPFEFKFDGRNSRVQIGACVNVAVEPIKNPVTGEAESVQIRHGTGFIFQEAEAVAATEMKVSLDELQFSWPNKAAFVASVRYHN